MNDQIKQKLIEDIDNNVAGLTNIQIMQIADIIISQPPADQWIPCSERLPMLKQHIIGTFEHNGRRAVTDAVYSPQIMKDPWNLIAWMPAEPYKGVE